MKTGRSDKPSKPRYLFAMRSADRYWWVRYLGDLTEEELRAQQLHGELSGHPVTEVHSVSVDEFWGRK